MSASAPSSVTYLPWFSLTVRHNYYSNRCCPGLRLTPDEATSALLTGLRASQKASANGLRVAVPGNKDGSSPLIPLPANFALGFWVLASDAAFRQVTALPPSGESECPCWGNNGSSTPGQTLIAGTTALPGWAARAGETLVGRVALSSFSMGASFSLEFEAATSTWTYFLLDTENPTAYSIADESSRQGVGRLQFSDFVLQSPEPSWLAALQNGGGRKLWLYQSQAADVPWRQEGYTGLALEGGDAAVLQDLPNPAPGGTGMVLLNPTRITQGSPA